MMNRTQISNEYRALKYDMARTQRKFRSRRNVCKCAAVIVVSLLLFFTVMTLCSANTFGSQEPQIQATVTVRQGDCLWDIASRYSEGKDVRMVISEIRTHNDMTDADLYPGMVLEIPEME